MVEAIGDARDGVGRRPTTDATESADVLDSVLYPWRESFLSEDAMLDLLDLVDLVDLVDICEDLLDSGRPSHLELTLGTIDGSCLGET